uniref:Uncharacterized protein n=1 Tax=Leersia perrieri TaxID=77586 RepID=A0A0D9WNR8_9ORYZ
MPGLLVYSAGGLGFLALAALESLPLRLPSTPLPRRLSTRLHLRHLLAGVISLLCLVSAVVSAHHLSLPTLAASALFLLYSLAPFAPLPSPIPLPLLDLVLAAAFAEELLLFARGGVGAAGDVDGADGGCSLHAQSRVDYTIKCRTHEDYHRARSAATLQFNGHLALLVLAGAAAYAATVSKGNQVPSGYRMLSKEVQMEGMPLHSQFTLDSDEEKEDEGRIADSAMPVVNGSEPHHEIAVQAPDLK